MTTSSEDEGEIPCLAYAEEGCALHEDEQGLIRCGSFVSLSSNSSCFDIEEDAAQDGVCNRIKADDTRSLSSTRLRSDCSAATTDESEGCDAVHISDDDNSVQLPARGSYLTEEVTDISRSNSNMNSPSNSGINRFSPFEFTRRLACQHSRHRTVTKRRPQQQPQPTAIPLEADPATADTSTEPVVVLGVDISHLSSTYQFLVCAAGVFSFNLSFGFLQEFVAVEICNRNLGLFLATMQFTGYTFLSYLIRMYVNQSNKSASKAMDRSNNKQQRMHSHPPVPTYMYLALGGLSAVDMAMTNMAMHYINYPAKTLMKSSRVVFTMIFGVLLAGKRYRMVDYLIVLCMVGGLAIFLNADASSNAIFEPMGVFMLTISLICDGATNIMSETIMKNYGVGQDELIFRMYSLALVAVVAVATYKGDLRVGFMWMMKPGTYDEWQDGVSEDEITWNALGKVTMIILFSSMGFFGSSCSAAITKNFGALAMSMTSTARRATTLFISFFMFDNECTIEHVAGVFIFISAMTTKSLIASSRSKASRTKLPTSPPPKFTRDQETGRPENPNPVTGSGASETSQQLFESQQLMESHPTDFSRRTWSGK